MKTQFYPVRLLLIPALIFFATGAGAQVSGTVFRDINNDGIQQSSNPTEPGEFGVTVKAYDAANTLRGTATTNSSGNYSFSAAQVPSGLAVRLEFVAVAGDFPSKRINANRSNVQFVIAGAATININFAIASKKLSATTNNPYVATTKYTNGNATATSGANAAGKYDNLYVFPYDLSSDGGNSRRAKNQYTGAVFGLAWQKESRTLFMSAYLKRHTGFGPNGIGAIYQSQINTTGNPSNPTLFADVSSIGINVGTNPRTVTLPANATTPNTDVGVFANVGKMGIGGMELSDDGRDLYIVNMFEKKLHRINIGNPLKASITNTDVTGSWAIPDPGISGTVWHPMALKVQDHKFYIGGVCVKEITGVQNSTDTINMRGIVYEFDPASNSFTEVLRFPLTHRRGYINQDYRYEYRNNYWSAWQNSGDISLGGPLRTGLNGATTGANATGIYYPQPMFSAIEFDVDGSMIIGIRDRFGDQGGYANYFETGNGAGETYTTFSMGEMLRAGKSAIGFVLENAASVTSAGVSTTTSGLADNNPLQTGTYVPPVGTPWGGNYGPGGKYYYYNQNFTLTGVPSPWNSPGALSFHYVKATGGLAFLPGSNEVLYTALDPTNLANTHGMLKAINLGSNAGNMIGRLHMLGNSSGNPDNMGKSAAFGDLELLFDAVAMEIGNRVWEDANGNGIQDAGETGIANVKVILRSPGADGLYGNGDDQTWTVTTDANGNYYFDETIVNDSRRPASWLGVSATNSGILPGFEYKVEINALQADLLGLTLTGKNVGSNVAIDSDGSLSAGMVSYIVNPGGSTAAASSFENNYNIDFGFYSVVLPLKQVELAAVLNNNDVQVKWKTIEEFDVNKYHVERSTDGRTFTETTAVASRGNGSFSYAVTDDIKNIEATVIYYRLRILELSEKERYSEIVKVSPGKEMQFHLSPNPFVNNINLQIFNAKSTEADIRITNTAGQVVYRKTIVLVKGTNSVPVNNLQNLSRGMYIIEVSAGEKYLVSKIIKQ